MCVVSMVTDHYQEKWPIFDNPDIKISTAQWMEYLELKRKAEEYDKKTNQPDCIKPSLAEWAKAIEARIKVLEARKKVVR